MISNVGTITRSSGSFTDGNWVPAKFTQVNAGYFPWGGTLTSMIHDTFSYGNGFIYFGSD